MTVNGGNGNMTGNITFGSKECDIRLKNIYFYCKIVTFVSLKNDKEWKHRI
jgi:hypothetical protein